MALSNIENILFYCAAINFGLFMFSFIVTLLFKKGIISLHGKIYGIPEDLVARYLYLMMGFYKIVVVAFFIVPWIAVKLIGG